MSIWREELLTADEMRAVEATYEGPTIELMERAGRACAESAVATFPRARRWIVHCGGGANGGDGFVAARHLVRQGRQVELIVHAELDRLAGDALESYRRCAELELPVGTIEARGDGVIDALLGTGFAGELRPEAATAVAALNATEGPIVSVDVPSGVDASTGRVPSHAVQADLTVTFHRRKVAHAIAPAAAHCGRVQVVDIGLSPPPGVRSAVGRVRSSAIAQIPQRGARDNKYTAGSVVVVGGSIGLTGAPALTALSALRTGAGVSVMCVPAGLDQVFEGQALEVMTRPCADVDGALAPAALQTIRAAAERADALAVGPGLGRAEGTRKLVRELLAAVELPVVLDADGLSAFNGEPGALASRAGPTVLTPHAGELGRLLEMSSADVERARLAAAREAARLAAAVVVLKGADTIVADGTRDDGDTLVCDLGTPGLATAGTGDVLAGAIAAALAKGMSPVEASVAATALTGVASRSAGARVGMPGLIASDVVSELPSTLAASRAGR